MKETTVLKIPAIKEIVQNTQGIILYQEQVIEITRTFAGFTEEEADSLRKAMGKKNQEEMDKNKEKFISGAVKRGFKKSEATGVFEMIQKYAEYSFNKCLSGKTEVKLWDEWNPYSTLTINKIKEKLSKNEEIWLTSLDEKTGSYVKNRCVEVINTGIKEVRDYYFTKITDPVICTEDHQFLFWDKTYQTMAFMNLLNGSAARKDPWIQDLRSSVVQTSKTSSPRLEQTYNLRMEKAPHNYVLANGLISKNSHSCAYGFISYYTAYLKAHYPEHFIAATINSKLFGDASKKEQVIQKMIREAKRLDIAVEFPDINKSNTECTVETKKIILGLNSIKGLGEGFSNNIQKEREYNGQYKSLKDFCKRTWTNKIERNRVELLIKAGAFKSLNLTRKNLVEAVATVEKILKAEAKISKNQMSFFGQHEKDIVDKTDEEFSNQELLNMSKEAFGFYVEGHPLDEIKLKKSIFTTTEELQEKFEESTEKKIETAIHLYISSYRTHYTKRDNREMIYASAEDKNGEPIELTIFNNVWLNIKKDLAKKGLTLDNNCWVATGQLETKNCLLVSELIQLHRKDLNDITNN